MNIPFKTRRLKKDLPVPLTDAQRLEAAIEWTARLTALEKEMSAAKHEARMRKKLWAKEEEEIREIRNSVATGERDQPVECRVEFGMPDPGSKQLVRLDTGEVLEISGLTDDEAQQNLL